MTNASTTNGPNAQHTGPDVQWNLGICAWLEDNWASEAALVVKNPPANGGDTRDAGSIPGPGRSSGVGNGNPLQYSCLENSMMGRGAQEDNAAHGVPKSGTQLSDWAHTKVWWLGLQHGLMSFCCWELASSPRNRFDSTRFLQRDGYHC